MERAKAVVRKLEVKVEKAGEKGKRGRERRREWEDVNGGVGGKKRVVVKGDKEDEEDEKRWEDEEMDVEGEDGVALLAKAVMGAPVMGKEVVCGIESKEVEAEIL